MNSTRLRIALLCAALLALGGCARYQPTEEVVGISNQKAPEIRAAILKGAARNRWVTCQKDENTLRLTLEYKGRHAVVNARYQDGRYTLEPDEKLTQWTDESGNVHKKINNLTLKLKKWTDKYLLKPADVLMPEEILTCAAMGDVHRGPTAGVPDMRPSVVTELSWLSEPTKLPAGDRMSCTVLTDGSVPDHMELSMKKLMSEQLKNRRILALETDKSAYVISLKLRDYKLIFNIEDASESEASLQRRRQSLKVEAIVSAPTGEKICKVDASINAELSAAGFINGASDRITDAAQEAVFKLLDRNFLDSVVAVTPAED